MEDLANHLPAETIIFDEALTVALDLVHYIPPTRPGYYFSARGGSLGLGFPGAIGAKLAHPDKTVIGFSGDGGCMYTLQALWTAAHYKIGAKFVVCNNRSYELLKLQVIDGVHDEYWRGDMRDGKRVYEVPATSRKSSRATPWLSASRIMRPS